MPRASEPYRADAPVVAELAAGAIVMERGATPPRFLLLHDKEEDRWCLPKGHVEPGETLAKTALREVEEETGLSDVQLEGELGEVSYRFYRPRDGHNVQKTTVYFLAQTEQHAVRPEPIFDRWDWVTGERALELVRFDTDREIVRKARRRLASRKA